MSDEPFVPQCIYNLVYIPLDASLIEIKENTKAAVSALLEKMFAADMQRSESVSIRIYREYYFGDSETDQHPCEVIRVETYHIEPDVFEEPRRAVIMLRKSHEKHGT